MHPRCMRNSLQGVDANGIAKYACAHAHVKDEAATGDGHAALGHAGEVNAGLFGG